MDRIKAARVDWAVALLAAATTLFHLFTVSGYGIFRDELYYFACADHLAWGYVDHPPLVAVVAWLVRHTLGTSLLAVRLVPALCAGLTVLLAALIARELGGRRFAQFLAGWTVALAPQYLGMMSIFSMNPIDVVIWAALLLLLVRILRTGDGRLWLWFGVLAGVGLENKLSVLFLGFGVAVGLVGARRWQLLRDRRLWIGLGIAVLLIAPHIVWQIVHGWPTREFVENATRTKNIALSPWEFVTRQIEMMNPVVFPLWLAGLGYLLLSAGGRAFRTVGYAYLAILGIMLTQNAKPYYLAPIYPALLAAGAVALERVVRGRILVRSVTLVLIGVTGALLAPLAKPLLPVDTYVRYAAALGVAPGTSERHELGRLPQHYADMQGWEELADAVAAVVSELPEADRERACVFAENYGQAGAVDFFRPGLQLPPAISGHNSYWMWGPGNCDGQVMIVIGGTREGLTQLFDEVVEGGRFQCADCLPAEGDKVLWVCRGLRVDIGDAWDGVKHYD